MATLAALYFSFWWNRYLSPTSGGELFYIEAGRLGMLPYRDYYLPSPPGAFLLATTLGSLFGGRLIAMWAFGVVFEIVVLLFLYQWLTRHFRPSTAAVATLTAFVCGHADIADQPYFYNHTTIELAFLATFASARSLTARPARAVSWAAAAGALFAASALVKQTVGILACAAALGTITVLLLAQRRPRRLALVAGALIAGWTVPVAGTWAWLQSHQLVASFLDQTFLRGPSSKGGLINSLLRPLRQTIAMKSLLLPGLLAVGVLGLVVALLANEPASRARWRRLGFAVALVALTASLWESRFASARTPLQALAYLSMLGSLVLGLALLPRLWRGVDPARTADVALLAAIGFSSAYAESISWPCFEIMIFPGLALVIVLVLERPRKAGRDPVRLPVLLACVALTLLAIRFKQNVPAAWGRWFEPPLKLSDTEPQAPELAGFVLSPTTASFYDAIPALVEANSGPDDTILVYPNMPILYALAHRRAATFALMHWVDVCPDYVALADVDRLLAAPPAVMVLHEDGGGEFATEEGFFRGGQRSGVRAILATIHQLQPQYHLIATLPVPGHPSPVTVWARNQPR